MEPGAEPVPRVDPLAVDAGDDVPGLQAGIFRRGAVEDTSDHGSVDARGAVAARVHLDAEEAADPDLDRVLPSPERI